MIFISTVTPVYAGVKYLEFLISQLNDFRHDLCQTKNIRHKESIFVIDGSDDGSFELLETLKIKYKWIVTVNLSKNFGQHAATKAGIQLTDSDLVVTLDEDLQHRPSEIKNLLIYMIAQKADIVYAKPKNRVHQSTFRNTSSVAIKFIFSKLSGNPFFLDFNSFRLINGPIARSASSAMYSNVYFDVALTWFSDRITTAPINLLDIRDNNGTKSSYSFIKLFKHAKNMAISTNTNLPKFLALFGFVVVFFSFLSGLNIIYTKIFGDPLHNVPGWATISTSIFFLGGIIILMLSIIIEYISNVTLSNMGKPSFAYSKQISFDLLVEDSQILMNER